MQRIPNEKLLLPDRQRTEVICGKTLVGWENAVVYVHNKKHPYTLPTHLHFSFKGKGQTLVMEVVRFVGQWTWYPNKCLYMYQTGDHEYHRAMKMAIQVVETFRRKYMCKHGNPPGALFDFREEFDPETIKEATDRINHRVKQRIEKKVGSQINFDLRQ